ncbi:hypothetical protein BGZ83_002859 [Gryganskiella cystojenkinii]|nr:hypothetical protein BGZ83_002859 [Gryganskiella cystojenkinii]
MTIYISEQESTQHFIIVDDFNLLPNQHNLSSTCRLDELLALRNWTGPESLAKKAKARTIIVKLLSTAGTGFFYTTRRPRTTAKLSFMKFDPRANQNVLFNEAKINRPN